MTIQREAELGRQGRIGLIVGRKLASRGIGRALHEQPVKIPALRHLSERRRIASGLVFALKPFLPTGTGLGGGWRGRLDALA